MSAVDSRVASDAQPEQMIDALNRRRQLTLVLALFGVAVGLGSLFLAAGAMYTKDPVRELRIEGAALQPAPAAKP
ncbi:MAG TPA: hypothetical protein VNN80_06970 [Polyangiaceae bacterium]|nr:hypothetical protein [Polyangiaceae bacterium]